MRASRGLPFGFSRLLTGLRRCAGLLLAGGLCACTLITDVDREKIPQPSTPPFDEVDAGPQPTLPDAGEMPDASLPPEEEPLDAGSDAGLDAGVAADAAPDADAG
jgi:hypothetical protein